MKYILYAFLIYLVYEIIFKLVIPVSKATSQVKEKMREMQAQQQQEQYQRQQAAQAQAQAQPEEKKTNGGDYIEFEEVK